MREAATREGIEIGVAVGLAQVKAQGPLVAREFTSVSTENALKWAALEPQPGRYAFADADAIVAFAGQNGLRVRGHTLIWSRLNGLPAWLAAAPADPPAAHLRTLALAHIERVVGRYRGRIAQWDVVNEPMRRDGLALEADNPFLGPGGEEVSRGRVPDRVYG